MNGKGKRKHDVKKEEWKFSRGYSCNTETVVLELKLYSVFLNLRKIENLKWPKMYREQNNIDTK